MRKSILLCAAVAVWTVAFAVAAVTVCAVAAAPAAAADNDTLAAVKAGRVVKMSVTGNNVNLRNQPSMKGKVVAQTTSSSYYDDFFYCDAAPIEDKQDGSIWYKILFTPAWPAGRRGIIAQIDKIPFSGFSYLYVNSKFLKEYPLHDDLKAELEYFKQGRPPLLKVGDGISEIKKHNRHNSVTGQYRITPTLKPITLCAEPVKGAKTFELPKGSNIVDYREAVSHESSQFADFVPDFLAVYIDMEEKEWIPVVDGKALQVIGWAEPAALDEVLPAPFDWSKLNWPNKLDWPKLSERYEGLEEGLWDKTTTGKIMNQEYPLFIRQSPEVEFFFDEETGMWDSKSGHVPQDTHGGDIDRGLLFYVVNPNDDAAKGMEPGILLHDAKAKKYSFLPVDKELIGDVGDVAFSPNGKTIVVVRRFKMGLFEQLMVYDAENLGREPKKTFEMADGDNIFFVDDARFAFTLFDDKLPRTEAANFWGTSAALYDLSRDEGYVVLKGATATENFAVTGLSGKTEITVNVTSVKSEKDWEDTEKRQNSKITVKVPAAR